GELGCDPAGLRAAIGPAIGGCCYEVSDEVAQAVRAATLGGDDGSRADARGRGRANSEPGPDGLAAAIGEPRPPGRDEVVRTGPRGRRHVDLAAANRRQLLAAGL